MIKNYLTIAFRNLLKSKIFSSINIIGLGVGLTACLLILQFVMFELSYDKFNEKFDRIYRVTNDRFQHGKIIQHGTIMYPTIGPTMAADFPEVEGYTRLMPGGGLDIKIEDEFFRGDECIFADANFLTVFTYPLVAGDPAVALKGKHKIVLSTATASKYFKITDGNYISAVGKTLYWGLDTTPYEVTAVCANIPENSHLRFDALISYETLYTPEDHGADDSWTWSDMRHYLLLKPGVDYKSLEAKFPEYSQRHFQGDKVSGSIEKFYLQPLHAAHLYSDYEYDIAETASGKAVWAMLIVAAFILVIAWINYINLTTSKALERAKEVGLRKVMGATKSQLVRQFIFESILISLFAFVFAFGLTLLLQRPFNKIVGGDLSLWKVISQIEGNTLLLLAAILATGVAVSGFYPAFVLSSYQPITVLKGRFQRSSKGSIMRKALVIFQFMASAALITGTFIVSSQLKFMNHADLGLKISNTLVVESPGRTARDSTFAKKAAAYEAELATIPGVISATTSTNIPGQRLGRSFDIHLTDQSAEANVTMSFFGVAYRFFDTYNIPLIAGRKFEASDHEDKKIANIILNENAVKLIGIKNPEDAIGRHLSIGEEDCIIIGIVGNFHQEALKKPMEPILFFTRYANHSRTSVKINREKTEDVIAAVEAIYKRIFPGNPFEYFFLEDRYNRQYSDDNRFGTIVNIFAVLAIIVSCLGLIGLSSYTALQRTKEIGIRKVLGASTQGIVSLLSFDFLKLILIATLLGLPIAYYFLSDWLQTYAYRITLGWLMFLIPLLLILGVAAFTISFQIIRTALSNPADTLKYE